jgi:uncharacterized protein (TIGR04255 family)
LTVRSSAFATVACTYRQRIKSHPMIKKALKAKEYIRPPITEAVIEVVFANEMSSDALKDAAKKLEKNYSNNLPINHFDVRVDVRPDSAGGPKANFNSQKYGHRLSSADQTEILIIWPKSIAVSQVAPYKGWDSFQKRFNRDYKALKKELGHRELERIGVRYINRIDIPAAGPIVEHEEYLKIFPKLPNGLTPLTAYAVQAEIQMPEVGANLRINSAAVPSPIDDHASFVIDLDFYRLHDLPKTDKALSDYLGAIRLKKNEVFESLVTNKARRLFNNAK